MKTAVERDRPSSHASKAVSARIEAGPVWVHIIDSGALPGPAALAADLTLWQRLRAWRRTMSTARLMMIGMLVAGGVTAFTLTSGGYRWPSTIPAPGAPPPCCVEPELRSIPTPTPTPTLRITAAPVLKHDGRPATTTSAKPPTAATSPSAIPRP